MLGLDRGIRFVGVADTEGRLVGHAYRKGIVPLLTPKETEVSVLQSFIRMSTRTTLEQKLGGTVRLYDVQEGQEGDHTYPQLVENHPHIHGVF
jgi:hypothetical protein